MAIEDGRDDLPNALHDEATALIHGLIDGELTPAEVARLDELVRTHDSIARAYLWEMQLHRSLPRHVAQVDMIQRGTDLSSAMILPALVEPPSADADDDEWAEPVPMRIPGPVQRARRNHFLSARWAAAVLLPIGVVAGIYIGRRSPTVATIAPTRNVTAAPEPATVPDQSTAPLRPAPKAIVVAVVPPAGSLVSDLHAEWETTPPPVPGQPLPRTELSLRAGLVRLRTENGVSLVVRGPAKFRLESSMQLDLADGAVTAVVPGPAHGFAVQTPSGRAVDLGTEFGVAVAAGEPTRLAVFRGTVQASVRSPTTAPVVRTLTHDQAVTMTPGDASPRAAELARQTFVRTDEFEARRRVDEESSFGRWLAYSYEIRHDPTLMLYYPCEAVAAAADDNTAAPAAPDTVVPNRAMVDAGQYDAPLDARSPQWSAGRWPQKRALAFNAALSSRLAVGAYPIATGGTMTFAAWVNAASRPMWASIAKSRGDTARGQFALGLYNKDGDLVARVFTDDGNDAEVRQGATAPIPIGQWVFVAMVVDGTRVHLYRDGAEVAAAPCGPVASHPTLRGLAIGYRAGDDGVTTKTRSNKENWNGSIDEVALFHRPLSPDEIRQMYEAGKPD